MITMILLNLRFEIKYLISDKIEIEKEVIINFLFKKTSIS